MKHFFVSIVKRDYSGLLVLNVSRAQPQGACEAGVQTSLGVPKNVDDDHKKAPPFVGAQFYFESFLVIFGHFWSFSVKCQV